MDGMQLFKFKPRNIITALVVTSMISLLLLIIIEYDGFVEIQNEVGDFKYARHHNTENEITVQDYNERTYFQSSTPYNHLETVKMILKNNLNTTSRELKVSTASCSFIKTCVVSCQGGTLQEVVEKINGLIENGNTCTTLYMGLELNGVIFPENSIGLGWLQDLAVNINILVITSTDLEELGEKAFSGKPFGGSGNPLSLTLINTNIGLFRKSTFTGSSLRVLGIKSNSMRQSITIEENFLEDTSYSLEEITITHCLGDIDALKNFTEKGTVLAGLSSLGLSYNMITKLESDMFSKAPNLKQLYLESVGLTEIEVGAFKGLGKILTLYINNNNLKTVPQGVFDDFDSIEALYLDGNPWNCTCDMQWFKQYIMSLAQNEYRKCKVGTEYIDMVSVEFCPANSSTTTTTTKVTPLTSPSTKSPITTPLPSPDVTSNTESSVTVPSPSPDDTSDFIFEKIICRNLLVYPFENVSDDDTNLLLEAVFKRRNINFTVLEIGNSLTYRVNLAGAIKSTDFLIWTNIENRADYGCIYNINGYVLMNLQFEKTYTLCLSSNDTVDTYAILADDCTAISTPTDWKHRAWLSNNQKTAVVLSFTVIFLVTLGVASGAVYYLVKYNPELIKGNKRVLIVKRGSYSPNVLVMPSKKDNIRHVSLCTNYEGYLTPKLKRWGKNKFSDLRYQELETISDNSIDDSFGDKITQMATDDKTNEKNIYEPPPPVPPNHPSKRRDSGRPYFYSNM